MQPIGEFPTSIYSNFVFNSLGKATDFGQKSTEYFCALISKNFIEMKRGGRTDMDLFYECLYAEVKYLRKKGSIADEDDVDIVLNNKGEFERRAVTTLRRCGLQAPVCKFTMSQQAQSVVNFSKGGCLFLVASPVVVPLGITSLGLRAALQRKIDEVACTVPDKKIRLSAKQFSIMTLNCSLFESRFLNDRAGLKESLEWRARGIGRFLRDNKTPVICLQGVYHALYAEKEIVSRLNRKQYWTAFTVKPEKLVAMSPGLLTASRYPIREVRFRHFKCCQDELPTISVGVLLTTLEVQKGKCIVVANTRLVGRHEELVEFTDNPEVMRKVQLREVRKFTREFGKESSYPIFDRLIVGDLGISRLMSNSEFRYTQAINNPEYDNLEQYLLNKYKKLAYVDLTNAVRGTQLDPHSVIFQRFFDIVSVQAYKYLKKKPITYRSKGAGGRDLRVQIASPPKSHMKEYFIALLSSGEDENGLANELGWEKMKIRRVHDALMKANSSLKAKLFTYPDCTDHICMAKRKKNLFSKKPQSIEVLAPISEIGVLTDKLAVRVDFQLKP